jgi:signal transduction histidine kinase/DNA-binding response OmpR family regulator
MPESKIDILIVDDLPEKLLVYETVLAELGENLVTVRSGAEALKLILRQEFAVILLDVLMPGMDGLETARLIRQRRRSKHTPIIFITAFADEVRATEGYAHGAVDYIPTPIVPEVLRAKVSVFVELFRMRRQVAFQAEEQAKRAAAEEAARRSAFLADASRALTSSLDFDVTVRRLLGTVVPGLADLAAVTRAAAPDRAWRSELAWSAGPGASPVFQSLTDSDAPHDQLRDAHDRVLAGLGPVRLNPLDIPFPGGEGRVRSAVILPLVARGRTLGALTLAQSRPDRALDPADVALAEDLAGRAGVALDNALLVRDIQESDRHRGEFLAMLAHELRNPLAPIRNATYLLRLLPLQDETLIECRDVIDRQVTHLVRLVDDLLDVSRISQGKIRLKRERAKVEDIVAIALEATRPLIEEKRHRLEVSLPAPPATLDADPARVSQVVSNLLHNAAKYTDPGGHLWLEVCRDGEEFVFRVRDTGVGIPDDVLPRVFDLFAQADRSLDRSQGGLGIGLTLVRRLVEMHGGTVRAFSEGSGKGSEFVVRLPATSPEEAAPSAFAKPGDRAPSDEAASRRRVLVVDDNVDAASSLASLLQIHGHEVHTTNDGPSSLSAAARFRPDVVLLDIGLPGLSGYEVARRLRQDATTRGATLVALTGYGQEEDRAQSAEAGFDHHLVKPVQPSEILRLLRSLPQL